MYKTSRKNVTKTRKCQTFLKKMLKKCKGKEKHNTDTTSVNAFWKHATPPTRPSQRGSMTGQFWGARCDRRCQQRRRRRQRLRQRQPHQSRSTATLSTLRSTATFGFPHFPVRVARQPVGVEMKYVDESLINLRHDKTSGVSVAVAVAVSVCVCICNCVCICICVCGVCLLPLCWQAF